MVNKTHAKRKRDIKTKLMAAICMLLVSSIMMVSTTYAWFTLSTAPEVTGINTAVGANGNLEMALLPKDGNAESITTGVNDSTKPTEERNITWGNLVDLSDSTVYGLDQITLYPAALNLTDTGKIDVTGYILETPKYGADGRVSELVANALTGYYDKTSNSFLPNSEKGVRAVGAVSGMTPRQLSYRNALSAGKTAADQAANKASAALNANGSALANIAIEYGMNSTGATFNKDDLAALRALINGLNGTNGALKQIEKAYLQYILAYAASSENTAGEDNGETVWAAVEAAVKADGATLTGVIAAMGGESVLPEAVKTGISKYNAAAAQVTAADTALQTLEATLATNENATFTWEQIREVMTPLADPAKIKVNGFLASEVKEKLGDLVSSVLAQGGLKVILESGAGVFADIADQTVDYTASVNIERVEYQGVVLDNMPARMLTQSAVNPGYLSLVGTAVSGKAPAGTSATAQPIADFFGYIVDLAFRTNATDSKLKLQAEATDRIYGDNTNEETMGHGSTMTFMATTTDFTNDDVKGLMDAIKIVFFNPDDGTIYCYGKLDTANAEVGMDGVTAKMSLLGADATTGLATNEAPEDDAIMALNQNQATKLSVLVYLDGNVVDNGDVAATGSTTMTGKMNLQFASSATLVPMEYSSLHTPGENNAAGGGENQNG